MVHCCNNEPTIHEPIWLRNYLCAVPPIYQWLLLLQFNVAAASQSCSNSQTTLAGRRGVMPSAVASCKGTWVFTHVEDTQVSQLGSSALFCRVLLASPSINDSLAPPDCLENHTGRSRTLQRYRLFSSFCAVQTVRQQSVRLAALFAAGHTSLQHPRNAAA